MTAMKEMIQCVDLPTRQKLFFYELCKAGVVVFDVDNPVHFQVLNQMINLVKGEFDLGSYADESSMKKTELVNGRMLDALILKQIMLHLNKVA